MFKEKIKVLAKLVAKSGIDPSEFEYFMNPTAYDNMVQEIQGKFRTGPRQYPLPSGSDPRYDGVRIKLDIHLPYNHLSLIYKGGEQ